MVEAKTRMDQETTHHYKKATDYEAPDHSKGNTISPNDNQNVHYSSLVDEAVTPSSHGTSSHSHHGTSHREAGSFDDEQKSSVQGFDSRYGGVSGMKEAVDPHSHSASHSGSHLLKTTPADVKEPLQTHSTHSSDSHHSKVAGAIRTASERPGENVRRSATDTSVPEVGALGDESKSSAYPHDSRYGAVGGMKETTNPLSSNEFGSDQGKAGGFSSKTPPVSSQQSGEVSREGRSFGKDSHPSTHARDFNHSGISSVGTGSNHHHHGSTSHHSETSTMSGSGKPDLSSSTAPEGVKESFNPRTHTNETDRAGGRINASDASTAHSHKSSALHSGVSGLAGATGLAGSSGAQSTSSPGQGTFRHGDASEKSDSWKKPSSVSNESSSGSQVEGVTESLGSLSTSDKNHQSSSHSASSQTHRRESSHSGVSGSFGRHDPKNPLDVKHHFQKEHEMRKPLEGDDQKPDLSDNFNNLNSRNM